MHTILKVTMSDVACANEAILNGKLEVVVKKISDLIQPEFSYFYSDNGYRCGLMVFELNDVTMIPQIAEPFFLEFNAKVEFLPAMSLSELQVGLENWQKQESNFSSLS